MDKRFTPLAPVDQVQKRQAVIAAMVECDDFDRTHKTLLNPRLSARASLKVSVLIGGYYTPSILKLATMTG